MQTPMATPDGQPTDAAVYLSHLLVGLAAGYVAHQAFGAQAGALAFIVVVAAHHYFDAPAATKIAQVALAL